MFGGDRAWKSWGELLHSATTGESGTRRVFGLGSFEYLAANPDQAIIFNAAMAENTRRVTELLVSTYDFSQFQNVVDVGGGSGALRPLFWPPTLPCAARSSTCQAEARRRRKTLPTPASPRDANSSPATSSVRCPKRRRLHSQIYHSRWNMIKASRSSEIVARRCTSQQNPAGRAHDAGKDGVDNGPSANSHGRHEDVAMPGGQDARTRKSHVTVTAGLQVDRIIQLPGSEIS